MCPLSVKTKKYIKYIVHMISCIQLFISFSLTLYKLSRGVRLEHVLLYILLTIHNFYFKNVSCSTSHKKIVKL